MSEIGITGDLFASYNKEITLEHSSVDFTVEKDLEKWVISNFEDRNKFENKITGTTIVGTFDDFERYIKRL